MKIDPKSLLRALGGSTAVRALLVSAALVASSALPARAQLVTDFELKDGPIHDLAGQGNASTLADTKRIWLAQGRVRAALRASDGKRILTEDRKFTDSGVQAKPVSIEVDDQRQLLYTLTDEKFLYREDISTASSPLLTGTLDLRTLIPAATGVVDLKLWRQAPDDAVFVLCSDRLLVVRDVQGVLKLIDQAHESTPLTDTGLPPGIDSINAFGVRRYERMTVAKDGNRVIAYIVATAAGYGTNRPLAKLMLLCDLDSMNGYDAPTFRRQVVPPTGTPYSHFLFRSFLPCAPTGSPCPGVLNSEHSVNDIAVAADGASRIAYVACGKTAQLQRVDVTDAFATGTLTTLLPQIDVDPTTGWDLDRVRVDRSNPKRLFVTVANFDLHVLDVTNPSSPGNVGTGTTERFGPSLGDLHVMSLPGHAQTIWTGTAGNVDHLVKAIDVVVSPPAVIQEHYWTLGSDGGVALPPNAIYLPNFGGVARYAPGAGGTWVADPLGFQPAEVPAGSGNTAATEHIAIGRNLTATGDDRLFTANGIGGFNEFRLDVNLNPLPATSIAPPLPATINPSWSTGHNYYSNDVAVTLIQGQPFVLVDVMNQTRHEAALIAYAWDPTLNTWKPGASAWWLASAGLVGDYNTDVIHLGDNAGGSSVFAFVNHVTGFASLNLSWIGSGPPSLTVVSNVSTFDALNASKICKGIAHSRDRLFVAFKEAKLAGGAIGGRVNVYSWDPATGIVSASPIPTYLDQDDICFVSFGYACDFSGAFRLRYLTHDPVTGCGALYVCGDSGYLYELKYDHGPTSSAADDLLSYNAYWKSDYSAPMQDANIYDFGSGPRILAVKDSETFALVRPSAVTCP